MRLNTLKRFLTVGSWRWVVNLLIAGMVSLHKNISDIQSRSNTTRFESECGPFCLFKLYSLPSSSCGLLSGYWWELWQDDKGEGKSTLGYNTFLTLALGKDDFQTTEWSVMVGHTDTIRLTDILYHLVGDPSGSSKT